MRTTLTLGLLVAGLCFVACSSRTPGSAPDAAPAPDAMALLDATGVPVDAAVPVDTAITGDEPLLRIATSLRWGAGLPDPALSIRIMVHERRKGTQTPTNSPMHVFGGCEIWKHGPEYAEPDHAPIVDLGPDASVEVTIGTTIHSLTENEFHQFVVDVGALDSPAAGTPITVTFAAPGLPTIVENLEMPEAMWPTAPAPFEVSGIGGAIFLEGRHEPGAELDLQWSLPAGTEGPTHVVLVTEDNVEDKAVNVLCSVTGTQLTVDARIVANYLPDLNHPTNLYIFSGAHIATRSERRSGLIVETTVEHTMPWVKIRGD